jgi:hypothetical protein
MSTITEDCQGRVQRVQTIVREKTGLELSAQEIAELHLLTLEPVVLARSIVYNLTGSALDLAEDGDDEREIQAAISAPSLRTS